MVPIWHEWIFCFGKEPVTVNPTWCKKEASIYSGGRYNKIRQADGSFRIARRGNETGAFKKMESLLELPEQTSLESVTKQFSEKGKIRAEHPANFPVALPSEYIVAFADENDIVVEPFGGGWYGSKVWHSTDKYRCVIWQCNRKFKGDKKCDTPHLTEEEIKQLYVSAVNKLITDKDRLISGFALIKDTALDTTALQAERDDLQTDLQVVSELMQQSIFENAHVALDQAEYQKHYEGLVVRFDKAKARLETVIGQISDKQTRQATIEAFLADLSKQDGLVTEFSPMLWYSLADFITVYSRDDIRVTFKDGTELQA